MKTGFSLDRTILTQQAITDRLLTAIARSPSLSVIFSLFVHGLRQGLGVDRVVLAQYSPQPRRMGRIADQASAPGIPPLQAWDAAAGDSWFPLLSQLPDQGIWTISRCDQSSLQPLQWEFCQTLGLKSVLHLPLGLDRRPWGCASLQQLTIHRDWTPQDLQFVQRMGQLLCLALTEAELRIRLNNQQASVQTILAQANHQKEEQLKAIERERALSDVVDKIRQTLELQTLLQTTVTEVAQLLRADQVTIIKLLEDEASLCGTVIAASLTGLGSKVKATDAWLERESLRLTPMLTTHFQRGLILVLDDTQDAPPDLVLPSLTTPQATLITPLFTGDRLWGLLSAHQSQSPRVWESSEIEFVLKIALNLGVAIQQAELLQRVQEQSKTMENTLADLTAIVDNLADGLLVTDVLGRVTRYNPALLAMFDLQGVDLEGAALAAYFPPSLTALLSGNKRQETQVVTADVQLSGDRQGQALITSITKGQGQRQPSQCLGTVMMIRDVTHEREVERMKTNFLATVSHELRTPLTSVLGFAAVIQNKLHTTIFPQITTNDPKVLKSMERVTHNLAIIESEADRLTVLINDVLDIAKMEAGKMVWANHPCRLEPILRRAIATLAPQAESKGIDLTLEIEPDLPLFTGDENRILQVALNLVSNAIKFTTMGRVVVQAQRMAEWLRVEIVDSGPGIAEADLAKIFEPFQQGGDLLTSKPQGTGLGLPICQQIIDHHGGSIRVESTVGQGSTFRFTLPIDGSLSTP